MYHRAGRPLRRLGWLAPVSSPPPVKLQALPSIPIVRPEALQHRHHPNSNHCPKPRRKPQGVRENSTPQRDALNTNLKRRNLNYVFNSKKLDEGKGSVRKGNTRVAAE